MSKFPTNPKLYNPNGILFVTIITSFFIPFLGAAVNIALPTISSEFSINAESMSWIAMSYLLSSVVFLIPCGKLADIYGRKKMFLYGNIVLTIGSLLCSFSSNINTLIAFRIFQGIGSAMILSSSMAIITSSFPPEKRGKIIGFNVSAVYLGLTLSPVIGGILTEYFGWRSLFQISVFAGILIIASTIHFIKTEWAESKDQKFDKMGSVYYMISMVLMMIGFSKLPETFAIILTLIGLVGIIFFISFELKISNPLIELSLFFKNKLFAYSNLAALINYAATFAVTFMLSLYLQFVKGLSPRETGMLLMTQPAIMTFVASFSGRLSDKYNAGLLSSIGMAINVLGLIMLVFVSKIDQNLYLIISLIILGAGFGLFSSPNTNSIMSSVEKKYLGIASATVATMRILGQMFSMAIATMIIHFFIDNEKITTKNFTQFNQSMITLFIIFSFLCFIGVFASLARNKS